jgi:hypothetical protein
MSEARVTRSSPRAFESATKTRARRLGVALLAAATLLLAMAATRLTLAETGGHAAVPLDDTFIHFQFAKRFAQLAPFSYSVGEAPVPGATSLVWPLTLAAFWKLGFQDSALIWPAWILGWLALFGVALETWRLGRRVLPEGVAFLAGAAVPCFGGLVWGAGSGMEIVPFTWWLMLTARVSAEWHERRAMAASRRELGVLLLLGGLAPLVRPEGVLVSAIACGALLLAPRKCRRSSGLVILAGVALPGVIQFAFTGAAQSTTVAVKWLPSSPYLNGAELTAAVLSNGQLLFGTLLDGQAWSAIFVPSGWRVLAWCALPCLAVLGVLRRERFRCTVVILLALGMLIPTTYDSFLWNRLRYLWPFAPAWLIALAAVAQLIARCAARLHRKLHHLGFALTWGLAVGFSGQLSWTLSDLAQSSDAIQRQQVALGKWAAAHLPQDARIGVNDTGAIAYFSDRPVFDVVGLTTLGEAKYWVAGAGSRFEHYERLERTALPSHFIVYPGWMKMPEVLGDMLTTRSVPGATILGGTTKAAYVADYSLLGSGKAPTLELGTPVDVLDVADLESEAAHDYQLLDALQSFNVVSSDPFSRRADGARAQRAHERFTLDLRPGGRLIARLTSEAASEVEVRVGGESIGSTHLTGTSEWHEAVLRIPAHLGGPQPVELTARKSRFAALHYWSLPASVP